MDVFVLDPASVGSNNINIKAGVLFSYWGQRSNAQNVIPISVGEIMTSTHTLQGWSTDEDLFVSDNSFVVDVSGFTQNGCQVNDLSFRGENIDLSINGTQLHGVLVDGAAPGVIDFVGFVPNTCSTLNYPTRSSLTVVKVPQKKTFLVFWVILMKPPQPAIFGPNRETLMFPNRSHSARPRKA